MARWWAWGPIGWAAVLAVILGFFLVARYLRYLERRTYYEALIRGAELPRGGPDTPASATPSADPDSRRHDEERRQRLEAGAITAGVGLAIVLGMLTIRIGPWLIAGLVPLFVGVAMIAATLAHDNRR